MYDSEPSIDSYNIYNHMLTDVCLLMQENSLTVYSLTDSPLYIIPMSYN